MMFSGTTILSIALSRVGEHYVLGARVPMADRNFHGPWDCAEFVSWSVYQAYAVLIGVRPPDPLSGDAYTGYWAKDAKTRNATIDVATAISTPGAILLRRPRAVRLGEHAIGHIAISRGDGTTVEARGRLYGVVVADGASSRVWDTGVLVPGVDYGLNAAVQAAALDRVYSPPSDYLLVQTPFIRGPQVVAAQRALEQNSCSVGGIDGVFGGRTEDAVYNFQAVHGVATDGVIGPETARFLGLQWPIVPTTADEAAFRDAQASDARRVVLASLPSDALLGARPGTAADPEHEDARLRPPLAGSDDIAGYEIRATTNPDRPQHWAKLRDGSAAYVGTETKYTDDMARRGLFQTSGMAAETGKAGRYDRALSAQTFGRMAHIIYPTAMGESKGFFACLNSYDRAAFTYGFYQAAAHTPGLNLIVLFRMLLKLRSAATFFPDLSLGTDSQGQPFVLCSRPDGSMVSLETVEDVVRPNGKVEKQLTAFMRYLNDDPTLVDDAEKRAAARLFLWLRADPAAQQTQVRHAISTALGHIKDARRKLQSFDPGQWKQVVWINDILHQGRGNFQTIAAALAASDPAGQLARIGLPRYQVRIDTVTEAIEKLASDGSLDEWTAADLTPMDFIG